MIVNLVTMPKIEDGCNEWNHGLHRLDCSATCSSTLGPLWEPKIPEGSRPFPRVGGPRDPPATGQRVLPFGSPSARGARPYPPLFHGSSPPHLDTQGTAPPRIPRRSREELRSRLLHSASIQHHHPCLRPAVQAPPPPPSTSSTVPSTCRRCSAVQI
jgi:hypothetical protein